MDSLALRVGLENNLIVVRKAVLTSNGPELLGAALKFRPNLCTPRVRLNKLLISHLHLAGIIYCRNSLGVQSQVLDNGCKRSKSSLPRDRDFDNDLLPCQLGNKSFSPKGTEHIHLMAHLQRPTVILQEIRQERPRTKTYAGRARRETWSPMSVKWKATCLRPRTMYVRNDLIRILAPTVRFLLQGSTHSVDISINMNNIRPWRGNTCLLPETLTGIKFKIIRRDSSSELVNNLGLHVGSS